MKKGVCTKRNGTKSADATECGSGIVADGVCCESACDQQCEACDVTAGTCSPVTGAPHGIRAKCPAGAGPCDGKACNGTDRTTCAGSPGKETACGAASCTGDTLSEAATCDGKGACGSAVKKSCAPYACDDAGKACRSDCATPAHCAAGNDCQGGKCVPKATAKCNADNSASIPLDTTKSPQPCAPFRCDPSKGTCFDNCKTSDDCQTGAACESGRCVPAAAGPTASDGGCTSNGHGVASPLAGLALLGALGALLRRRR